MGVGILVRDIMGLVLASLCIYVCSIYYWLNHGKGLYGLECSIFWKRFEPTKRYYERWCSENSSCFSNWRPTMVEIQYINWECKNCFAKLSILACDVYKKRSKYGGTLVGERVGVLHAPTEKIWMEEYPNFIHDVIHAESCNLWHFWLNEWNLFQKTK